MPVLSQPKGTPINADENQINQKTPDPLSPSLFLLASLRQAQDRPWRFNDCIACSFVSLERLTKRISLLPEGEAGFRRRCLRTFEPPNASRLCAVGRAGCPRKRAGWWEQGVPTQPPRLLRIHPARPNSLHRVGRSPARTHGPRNPGSPLKRRGVMHGRYSGSVLLGLDVSVFSVISVTRCFEGRRL